MDFTIRLWAFLLPGILLTVLGLICSYEKNILKDGELNGIHVLPLWLGGYLFLTGLLK